MNTYLLAVGCLIIVCYLQQFSCGAPTLQKEYASLNHANEMMLKNQSRVQKRQTLAQIFQLYQPHRNLQGARYSCLWNALQGLLNDLAVSN